MGRKLLTVGDGTTFFLSPHTLFWFIVFHQAGFCGWDIAPELHTIAGSVQI